MCNFQSYLLFITVTLLTQIQSQNSSETGSCDSNSGKLTCEGKNSNSINSKIQTLSAVKIIGRNATKKEAILESGPTQI